MKKIIILIFVTLLMGNIVNANEVNMIDRIKTEAIRLSFNNDKKVKDYNFIVNKKQLGKYLGLSDSIQLNNVYRTYESFCGGMLMAGKADDEEERLSLIFNSIDSALTGMSCYLDKKQYRKFLSGLNKTLYNKGFLEEACMYGEK